MGYAVVASDVREMFASIANRYDITNSVLSFGIHHYWRAALVRMLPKSTALKALDVCCGTADLVPILSRRFGSALGTDFCLPMLQNGQKKLEQRKSQGKAIGKVLVQSDALQLPFGDKKFDIVSVAFGVRNLENLDKGLGELARVTQSGGHLLVLEFGQPRGLIWGSLFRFYSGFMMPLIGGLLTGNRAAYQYLPKTASEFPCGEKFESRLRQAGLTPVRTKPLCGGIAWAYCARKES